MISCLEYKGRLGFYVRCKRRSYLPGEFSFFTSELRQATERARNSGAESINGAGATRTISLNIPLSRMFTRYTRSLAGVNARTQRCLERRGRKEGELARRRFAFAHFFTLDKHRVATRSRATRRLCHTTDERAFLSREEAALESAGERVGGGRTLHIDPR